MSLVSHALVCCAALCAPGAEPVANPVVISATPDTLRLAFAAGVTGPVHVLELRPYEHFDPAGAFPVAWRGEAAVAEIPRFDGSRDRMYAKFQVVSDPDGTAIGAPQYVTDLSGLEPRAFEIPWPKNKKGVTCIVDIDDAIATGTKYADEGVVIGALIDWQNPNPSMTWEVDGHAVPINEGYVKSLDAKYKRLTDAGMNFTPIPINLVPKEPQPGNPLIHPDTDLANAPMGHGAFNVVTEEGLRCYRAAIAFIADRYTRPDRAFGLISGIVVGNELQSHWVWHNQGNAPKEKVIEDYVIALRMADLAARSTHAGLRVYLSMEHHWTKRGHMNDPLKEIRGDEFLEGVNALGRAEGNFPWHVAFHPYPENLFEPRFWNDKTATRHIATPRVTFKNLEVLPVFLRQPDYLYDGQPRRIMLTEQGFHCPDTPDGEEAQAAAYAAAYFKVDRMPEIDAFILHRQVSMRDEGGLCLGLWTWDRDDPKGYLPGKRKKIWDVYRLADTDQWEEAFAFALPVIGIDSWDAMLPDYNVDMTPPPETDNLVFDFHEHMSRAEVTNEAAFFSDTVVKAAGWAANSILHHPSAEGVSTAAFEVALPLLEAGQRLIMTFDTMFSAPTDDGVRFSVTVDGDEVWSHTQTKQTPESHTIDLTPWAGKEARITLVVDPLENSSYDSAHWVQPQIVIE